MSCIVGVGVKFLFFTIEKSYGEFQALFRDLNTVDLLLVLPHLMNTKVKIILKESAPKMLSDPNYENFHLSNLLSSLGGSLPACSAAGNFS